ncbi:hypothetical protein lbkm_2137 [Lachnospiraceae bacterium KM106-2]|nr:hypothetical protein lbkm_2137 [Lachnospiraceae bacterium KM106-2]
MIEEIVNWKKTTMGIATDQDLMQDEFLNYAGTSTVDWFAFGIARSQLSDDYSGYATRLVQHVKRSYEENNTLDERKATEWHRIGLTLSALGEDIKSFDTMDFLGDGTYNRGYTAPLDTQGLNGYIWALILLDSRSYEVPDDAYETREEMINAVLSAQKKSGAFGLTEFEEDIDITAMALCALAPYKKQQNVKEAVSRALIFLSRKQTTNGDFGDVSLQSSESTAQVIIALTALGIDPEDDQRFVKSGKTALDGLLQYRNEDGGFAHSRLETEENVSNEIASEQALLALIAYERFQKKETSLYRFE